MLQKLKQGLRIYSETLLQTNVVLVERHIKKTSLMTKEAESKKVSIEKSRNPSKDQKLDTKNPGMLSNFITYQVYPQISDSGSTINFFLFLIPSLTLGLNAFCMY